MFAYCGNNPISRIDKTGLGWTEFWSDIKEWLQDKKEDAQTNGNTTTTDGYTFSAAFGFAVAYSWGVTRDKKGNVGLLLTVNGGGGMPNVGGGKFHSTTNAPTIYKQAGMGTTIGGSAAAGFVSVGAEYNLLIDNDTGEEYHGSTFSATLGVYPTPVELHGEVGYTWVWGFNVYDLAIGAVNLLLPG